MTALATPTPRPVAPGLVTITLPAYLVAQFREAETVIDHCHRTLGDWSDATEAAYDAANETRDTARRALREMVASWGCEPDHFAAVLG